MTRFAALLALAASPALGDGKMHTFDGKHSIEAIEVTAVYFVPNDRTPLEDWRDRVGYFARRIEAFHRREFEGQSTLKVTIHPEPLRSTKTSKAVRGDDPNQTFSHTVDECRAALKWPGETRKGFPILLVFGDINWRELDDFRRIRVVDGREEHEGNIGENGRHFPGAESGGARATYRDDPGFGLGLVSADGWRVPYSGSDCVAYHEGVGHTVGLPHPDPIDGSVMGVAQYQGWLNETYVNDAMKKALGWEPPDVAKANTPTLFDRLRVLPKPDVPKTGEPVTLAFRWPKGAKVKALRVRYQTELTGPWREVAVTIPPSGEPPDRLPLPPFEKSTAISYRIDATLDDGQTAELWGYFQVVSI